MTKIIFKETSMINPATFGYGMRAETVTALSNEHTEPFFVYDEQYIRDRCKLFMTMPNAYGIQPRFAMKANSLKAILQIIASEGMGIDASSLNEAKRAVMAGIEPSRIMLTTQEVPEGKARKELEHLLQRGMKYNVCSLTQLNKIAPLAAGKNLTLAMRVHPGVGSGESVTRNTGDKYSCFGVHLSDVPEAVSSAREQGIIIDTVHVHIGSGGDPAQWKENIYRELSFIEAWFPDAKTVNFGGGFRVARMGDETSADIQDLGMTAKEAVEEFYQRTGRKLRMEVEPGNAIMANAGYLVARVIDLKQTGPDGFRFVVLNGGMEVITRPLLYGARHPFTVINQSGQILFDDLKKNKAQDLEELIVVGRCCESGDSLTLDADHHIIPRLMTRPAVGDLFVVGGAGAYCSSMSLGNYNSHCLCAEYLVRPDGKPVCIRQEQNLEQLIQNELPVSGL